MTRRLAFIHDHFDYLGGGEQMLLRTAKLAGDCSVDLHLLWGGAEALDDEARQSLDAVYQHQWPHSAFSMKQLLSHRGPVQALKELWRKQRPDGILSFSLRSAIRVAPIARQLGIPNAWMCQQSFPLFSGRFSAIKERLGLHFLKAAKTQIVTVAEEGQRTLTELGIPTQNCTLIRNSVDYKYFSGSHQFHGEKNSLRKKHGLEQNSLVIVTVARCDPIKGLETLVKALAQLKNQGVQVGAFMVGGEAPHAREYSQELRDLAQSLGVAEQIAWVGEKKDVRPYLAAADLFVLPSRKEAFGLVLAEAGAAGLPLIASQVGGIPEIARHEETGLLFQSGSEQELAAAMDRVRQDAPLRARLGANAAAMVEREFNKESQDQLWRDFLARLRALPIHN